MRSTLCTCRLESRDCRLESPVQRTEANGAGEAVAGYWLRDVGCASDLQAVAATFTDTTEANRLWYYLTITRHGLRPWVVLQIKETGARAAPILWLFILVAFAIVVYATHFTNVNSHL